MWEHKFQEIVIYPDVVEHTADGCRFRSKAEKDEEYKDEQKIVTELSEQGWEAVSMVQAGGSATVLFKRRSKTKVERVSVHDPHAALRIDRILRKALLCVEWVDTKDSTGDSREFCPWCRHFKEIGHAVDCMRQLALE